MQIHNLDELTMFQADLLTGFANIVTMFSCFGAMYTVDHFGRRGVLVWGGFAQSLCFFILGALSKVGADQHSSSIGAAAGSFVFVYNFVFAVCWSHLVPPHPAC